MPEVALAFFIISECSCAWLLDTGLTCIMEENVRLLEEVAKLMPNQGISIVSFRRLYPSGESIIACPFLYQTLCRTDTRFRTRV
jgi:hypothetical protein